MLIESGKKMTLLLTFFIFICLCGEGLATINGYIPNSGDNNLTVLNVDDTTDAGSLVSVDAIPYGVATTNAGDFVFVTNYGSNTVSQIDTASNTLYKTHFVGAGPIGVAVSPDDIYVYVANRDGNLSVINTVDDSVTTIYVATSLFGVAVSPNGEVIYLTDETDNLVYVVEQEGFVVIGSVAVGGTPQGIAVSPADTVVVVANSSDGTINLIATSDYTVSDPLTVGANPFAVAITNDSSYAYITNRGDDTVSKVSLSDYSVTSISLTSEGDPADSPHGVAMYPFGSKLFVVNNASGTVKSIAIDDDNTVSSDFTVGNYPVGFGKFFPSQVPLDLTATLVGDTAIDISWTDNSDSETAFIIERKKFSKGAYAEVAWVDAGVTTYSDVDLGYYASYYYRVSAYNDYGSTIYSNEATAQTREKEYSGCFIATAAYGSLLEPQVQLLRDFRDRYLIISQPGRVFLDLYYSYSPPVARFIADSDILRFLVRWSLLPLVLMSWMSLTIGLLPTIFIFSLSAGLIAYLFSRTRPVSPDNICR